MFFKLYEYGGFRDDYWPLNSGNGYIGSFKAEGHHETIYGKPFIFRLTGSWVVLDKDKLCALAGDGRKFKEKAAMKVLGDELIGFLEKMEKELPKEYIWTFDDWSALTGKPRQCKVDLNNGTLEKIVYFQKGLLDDSVIKCPQGIFGIDHFDIQSVDPKKWIAKKTTAPVIGSKLEAVLRKHEITKDKEILNLGLQKGFIKRRITGEEDHDLVNKVLRGEDIDMKTQSFGTWAADIEIIELEDKLNISWEFKTETNGALKIFRKTDCFAQDKFSEIDNGGLIVDSSTSGNITDHLNPGVDYYYTANFYPWHSEISKSMKERSLKEKLFGGGEILASSYHLARFSVRVPGIAETQKRDFEVKKIEKQHAVELEQLEFNQKRIQQKIKDLNKDDLLTQHEKEKQKLDLYADLEEYKNKIEIRKIIGKMALESSIDDEINKWLKKYPDKTRREAEKAFQEALDNMSI